MRTGRYRVRRGFRGIAVVQCEHSHPSFIAGHVDASVRTYEWVDVEFDALGDIRITLGAKPENEEFSRK